MGVIATRKSLVEQAFELAAPVTADPSAKDELTALRQVQDHLLPVEERSALQVQARVKELELSLGQEKFNEPVLPLEPLGWRHKNGLPKLALLSLASPHFTVSARRDEHGQLRSSIAPVLPSTLYDAYRDVVKLAETYCVRRRSARSFTFTFDGVLPASVRQSIADALRSHRFHSLWMLAEAPEKAWQVETKKGISRREQLAEWSARTLDPLILGWASEALFVIDKFDLTTLEQYVLDEFSQKALLPGS